MGGLKIRNQICQQILTCGAAGSPWPTVDVCYVVDGKGFKEKINCISKSVMTILIKYWLYIIIA